MDAMQPLLNDEQQWPAVSAAYDFVVPSYQLLAVRYEAADTRLTSLITWSATLTLGAPVFAKAVRPNISFASLLFVLAMASAVATLLLALRARTKTRIILPNPLVLFRKTLHESEWEFKKNQLEYAGLNFTANAETIRWKGDQERIALVALIVEIALLILWITF